MFCYKGLNVAVYYSNPIIIDKIIKLNKAKRWLDISGFFFKRKIRSECEQVLKEEGKILNK